MSERYTAVAIVLHWLIAICILAMLFIGVGMVLTATREPEFPSIPRGCPK